MYIILVYANGILTVYLYTYVNLYASPVLFNLEILILMYNNSFYCHISCVKVPSSDVSITQTSFIFCKRLASRDRSNAMNGGIAKIYLRKDRLLQSQRINLISCLF